VEIHAAFISDRHLFLRARVGDKAELDSIVRVENKARATRESGKLQANTRIGGVVADDIDLVVSRLSCYSGAVGHLQRP
jgi:hypothetical protein